MPGVIRFRRARGEEVAARFPSRIAGGI